MVNDITKQLKLFLTASVLLLQPDIQYVLNPSTLNCKMHKSIET